MTDRHDRDGMNRSLERGIAILRAFKPGLSELGNAEIAERTCLPKATVSRLTRTLVSAGMLERDAAQRVYRLAPAVLSFAHAMRLSSPILSVIAPLMRAEATRRHVNVGLAAADGDMMVYLESFRYSPRASFRTVVSGQRVPVELTSLGRAYLWAIPREDRDRELAAIAKRRPKGSRQFRHDIERSFAELDELGYCAVRWQPGVVAVATSLRFDELDPHSLNMSLASDEPLADARRRLGPWLLDLKRRCLEKLESNAVRDTY